MWNESKEESGTMCWLVSRAPGWVVVTFMDTGKPEGNRASVFVLVL